MLLIGNVGYCHLRLFGCAGVNHIVLGNLWKSLLVYLERKGRKVLVSDVERFHFTHIRHRIALANHQYRLCLVAEFRANVTSYIVITLVQVQDAMDVQVIAA